MTHDSATVQNIVSHLQQGNAPAAADLCRIALMASPTDSDLHMLMGVILRVQGHDREGLAAFWKALAGGPGLVGARTAIVETVLAEKKGDAAGRDFSLTSGERQTADKVESIRADHRARYNRAALFMRGRHAQPWLLTGLDVFCGNGYGCRLVADAAGPRMVGIDGSLEAVALAERSFGDHRVVFGNAVFPFKLTPRLFDFTVCFESVEHVDDPEGFLKQVSESTDGPLFLSVPLEEGLPFAVNSDLFKHHVCHFPYERIIAMLAEVGRPVISGQWGQNVYTTKGGRVTGLLDAGQMTLGTRQADSQFLILAAERA